LTARLLFWCAVVLVIALCPRLYRWHLSRRERLARIAYGGKAAAVAPFPWAALLVTLTVVGLAAFVLFRCGWAR
jgi:hypothetical protein